MAINATSSEGRGRNSDRGTSRKVFFSGTGAGGLTSGSARPRMRYRAGSADMTDWFWLFDGLSSWSDGIGQMESNGLLRSKETRRAGGFPNEPGKDGRA